MRPVKSWFTAFLALACLAGSGVAAAQVSGESPSGCTPRTLVLSAMPVELGPLLARAKVAQTVSVGSHEFYVGRLAGRNVVLALTGIGPVNARNTTTAALSRFGCRSGRGVAAVLFSGVAGGDYIGDVTVADQWTLDDGRHLYDVDRHLLATARRVAAHPPRLESKAPAGDPACGCVTSPDAVTTVAVTHAPRIEVGGIGQTTDPFSGRALPCAPGGGDVFGCEPCPEQTRLAGEAGRFVPGVVPFADPSFFTGYFASTSSSGHYVASDEESAAVAAVASAGHVPFLIVRAVSDGGGDPLNLPGFPVQFFYYRQLAADNAAITTLALLAR